MGDTALTVDKLSVLGRVGDIGDLLAYLPEIDRQGMARFPFRHQWHFVDGSVLQDFELPDMRNWMRFEFNPAKCNGDIAQKVLYFLSDSYLTRIDWAVDYFNWDRDLTDLKVIDHLGRKQNEWRSGSGCRETLSIGARSSQKTFRLYNKKLERQEAGAHVDEEIKSHWRMEAQCRVTKGEDWRVNPFESVSLGWVDSSSLKLEDTALLDYLERNPEKWSMLTRYKRLKLEGLVRETWQGLEPSPSSVFVEQSVPLLGMVDEMLTLGGISSTLEAILNMPLPDGDILAHIE